LFSIKAVRERGGHTPLQRPHIRLGVQNGLQRALQNRAARQARKPLFCRGQLAPSEKFSAPKKTSTSSRITRMSGTAKATAATEVSREIGYRNVRFMPHGGDDRDF